MYTLGGVIVIVNPNCNFVIHEIDSSAFRFTIEIEKYLVLCAVYIAPSLKLNQNDELQVYLNVISTHLIDYPFAFITGDFNIDFSIHIQILSDRFIFEFLISHDMSTQDIVGPFKRKKMEL